MKRCQHSVQEPPSPHNLLPEISRSTDLVTLDLRSIQVANTTITDAFPSSAAFDAISSVLSSDADRKAAIKQAGGAIFAFTLKNPAGATESWYLDLKDSGKVGKGLAPEGAKPTTTLSLSDADFAKLTSGKANAQTMFMSGKLKIKGDMMKATKMEPILKKAQSKAKL